MCLNVACFVFRSQRSFLGFVFYLSILTSCGFSLATVVLMPFVAIGSGFVWLVSVCLATV